MAYTYEGIRPGAVGVNLSDVQPGNEERLWITPEEIARNKELTDNRLLSKGTFCNLDGGPFPHPYGQTKAKDKGILYLGLSMLGKISATYADLVLGEGFSIINQEKKNALREENQTPGEGDEKRDQKEIKETVEELIKYKEWEVKIWEICFLASIYGFVGIQPYQENGVTKYNVINPRNLFPIWSEGTQEIKRIDKKIPFKKVVNGEQKEFLLWEIHTKGRVEYHFYSISGNTILRELPLEMYTEFIDKDVTLPTEYAFDRDDFLITIIPNRLVEQEFESDYSLTSKRLQQALNNRCTREGRVMDLHADPKMIMPLSMLQKTGREGDEEWTYNVENDEVIFYDDRKGATPDTLVKFLTWDGQLTSAMQNRDFLILGICFETSLSPVFMPFVSFLTSSAGDTFSKFKLLSFQTLKVVEKKRGFLTSALLSFFKNFFTLDGYPKETIDNLQITFKESTGLDRAEFLAEIIDRVNNKTLSKKSAIARLDQLTEEEAQKELDQIVLENDRLYNNPLDNSLDNTNDFTERDNLPESEENI